MQTPLPTELDKEASPEVDPDLIFADNGVSGTTLARPRLDALRDKAAVGEIEQVLVLSPDRLARKYAHQMMLVEEFKKLGTEIVFNDGLAVEVQVPQWRQEEFEYLWMTQRDSYEEMAAVQRRIIELLAYAHNREAYRKRTEMAVEIVRQIESEGNFPQAD
jgi:hypothetical protein